MLGLANTFAFKLPGHYEAGMKLPINIQKSWPSFNMAGKGGLTEVRATLQGRRTC